MFAICVELLAGRYAATAYNDRNQVEWPPHPARLFSALVATWAEGAPHELDGIAERVALEWLEHQAAPEILADHEPRARSVFDASRAGTDDWNAVPVFVPVNDEYEVSEVDVTKLDEAEAAAAAATDGKARKKAAALATKLHAKLLADTAKAIAVPSRRLKEPRAGLRVLPENRAKQPRTFPVATPAHPIFVMLWPAADPDEATRAAFGRLLARLVRVGHSSSQVRAYLGDASAATPDLPRFRPDEREGEQVIRWVESGQVVRLCRAYDSHRETEPRVLPAHFVRYTRRSAREASKVAQSVFSEELIVYARIAGPRLPITAVAGIARQFRRALMSAGDQPPDSVVSGHRADGSPLGAPHVALVPLPVVAASHADGAIRGIAVVMPRGLSESEREAILRALGSLERRCGQRDLARVELHLDPKPLLLERVAWDGDAGTTLRRKTWTDASKRWATATPIALDRNPGNLHDADPDKRRDAFAAATANVIEAVTRIGLPAPIEADVLRSCVLPGTAKPRAYPRYPSDRTRPARVLVHARLTFSQPVRGPILLGAGRYYGLGLCLPVDEGTGRRGGPL